MQRTNRYESLRQPGVRGQVVARDFRSQTIYNTMATSITVITGELLPGVWDYGYTIHRAGFPMQSRLPGEGEGWFKTEDDARLYALETLRAKFDPRSPEACTIDAHITRLISPSLF